MSTFKNKKVWFSHLKYAGELVVKFTSGPVPSKFKKDELIAFFEVQGDETEGYNIPIENDTVLAQVEAAPKGRWVSLVATGDDAESQSLEITLLGNQPAEPQSSKGAVVTSERFGPGDVMACMEEVLMVVQSAFEDSHDKDGLTEKGKWYVNTLFDKWFSSGRFMPLYEGQPSESDYGIVEAEPIPNEEVEEKPKKVKKAEEKKDDGLADAAQIEAIEAWIPTIKWKGDSHDERDLKELKSKLDAALKGKLTRDAAAKTLEWLAEESAEQQQKLAEPEDDDLPF
jgi:hypothetical protein